MENVDTIAQFHFLRPWWLAALAVLAWYAWRSSRREAGLGVWHEYCDPALLPFVLQKSSNRRTRWDRWLLFTVAAATIVALAGPTWERIPTPVFRETSALVIALDLSRSMDAADIKPNRLARAKFKITDILASRKDGQTALVVFAGRAFAVTPLTTDAETIVNQLPALSTEIMPSVGSNVVDAIEKSLKLLEQSGVRRGDVLLMSDDIDEQDSDRVSELLSGHNARLSVLGVGTEAGRPGARQPRRLHLGSEWERHRHGLGRSPATRAREPQWRALYAHSFG